MSLYEIYSNQCNRIRVIKSGFIWPAFLFMWLWTAYKREYQLATIQFVLWSILFSLSLSCYLSWGWLDLVPHWGSVLAKSPLVGHILGITLSICLVIAHFYVGTFSHYWLQNSWVRRDGYQRVSNLLARSKKDAVKRYRAKQSSSST